MNIGELVVSEWVEAAQEDFGAALNLANVPYIIPTCYHCQQTVEKILKAYLIAKGGKLFRTHDLDELLRDCEKHSQDFDAFKESCFEITQYTAIRYPSARKQRNLSEQQMKRTLKNAGDILEFTKAKLKELGYEYDPNDGVCVITEVDV